MLVCFKKKQKTFISKSRNLANLIIVFFFSFEPPFIVFPEHICQFLRSFFTNGLSYH